MREDDIELTRKRLHLLMYDPGKDVSEELVQIRHAIYHQPDFTGNLHNLLCMQEMEIRQRNLLRPEQLNKIKAPTLVVWGRENPFGEVLEAHEMQRNIPGFKAGVVRAMRALATARTTPAVQCAGHRLPEPAFGITLCPGNSFAVKVDDNPATDRVAWHVRIYPAASSFSSRPCLMSISTSPCNSLALQVEQTQPLQE